MVSWILQCIPFPFLLHSLLSIFIALISCFFVCSLLSFSLFNLFIYFLYFCLCSCLIGQYSTTFPQMSVMFELKKLGSNLFIFNIKTVKKEPSTWTLDFASAGCSATRVTSSMKLLQHRPQWLAGMAFVAVWLLHKIVWIRKVLLCSDGHNLSVLTKFKPL